MSTLTLCATARLAQTLRAVPPDAAAAVWRTPQTATLGQWYGELAETLLLEGDDLPQALEPFSERLLWEKVIRGRLDDAAAPLFDVEGMAASAMEANVLVGAWALPTARPAFASDEVRHFLDWRERFLRRCQAAGWSDAPSLQGLLLDRLAQGAGHLSERIAFAGFDRFTPLERRLQQVLADRGVTVEICPFPDVDRQTLAAHEFTDGAAECATAAAWAKARLTENPAARLAIVVPDLEARRATLARLLDDALHPEALHPALAGMARRFNFSLGTPLAEVALVRTALDLLAVTVVRGRSELARFGRLLLDGAWSAGEREADGRARLEARLRDDLGLNVTLTQVARAADRYQLCPDTAAALVALSEAQAMQGRKPALPSVWAGEFARLLALAGWPGERTLASDEFQARQAFLLEVQRLGRLDVLLGPVGAGEALRRLGQIVRQRLFQPQTRGTPAVQVLGVLESAGLAFDALWVMGMNDDLWPPAPAPNPLLPAEMQRQAGTPRAGAEVELDFARRVQARLLTAAAEVRVSWARREGNRERRRTPLLDLTPVIADWPPLLTLAETLVTGDACVWLDDAQAPPVPADEVLQGGAGLLRAQAICPAWAFYAYRLGARGLGAPVEGLDGAARGTLVHALLEAFWTRLADSAALQALSGPAEQQAVADAVEAALVRFEAEAGQPLPAAFRNLEGQRLARLLQFWLPVERARDVPFAVLACEQEATLELGQIRLKTRVDRIDRLDDGRQVVIDYKTGSRIDMASWAGDRLFEPQLPLYAAFAVPAGEIAAATVFARVLVDGPGFAGIAEEKGLLPGVAALGDGRQKLFDGERFPDWGAVLAHWHARLHAVADEIAAGDAAVRLADPAQLAYCDVLPLLRLPEWAEQLAAAATAGADHD